MSKADEHSLCRVSELRLRRKCRPMESKVSIHRFFFFFFTELSLSFSFSSFRIPNIVPKPAFDHLQVRFFRFVFSFFCDVSQKNKNFRTELGVTITCCFTWPESGIRLEQKAAPFSDQEMLLLLLFRRDFLETESSSCVCTEP